MSLRIPYTLPIAARRLEYLFERLRLLDLQQEKLLCSLADEGIIINCRLSSLRVETSDPEPITRLKEQLIRSDRERSTIRAELNARDGRLLTGDSYEALFPGGPEGSFLSWQPGEQQALFYRSHPIEGSERHLLPDAADSLKAILH